MTILYVCNKWPFVYFERSKAESIYNVDNDNENDSNFIANSTITSDSINNDNIGRDDKYGTDCMIMLK